MYNLFTYVVTVFKKAWLYHQQQIAMFPSGRVFLWTSFSKTNQSCEFQIYGRIFL